MTTLACALLAAASCVSFDAARHSVTIEAKSTDCGLDTEVEFLLVGADSDHQYESMFVTDATPAEIADAFEKAGIPKGLCIDAKGASFWPAGARLELTPAFTSLVRETRGERTPPAIYTGGLRGADGTPVAATNSPNAVFALYGCAQSLIQLNDSLDQSATYGRFRVAEKIPQGEKRKITFTLDGKTGWSQYALRLEPGKLKDALVEMRSAAASNELSVTAFFAPELTVGEAVKCASALAGLDSPQVKVNGFPDGQLYYRAFLPQESWRDRSKRLCQPPEVHFITNGAVRVCEILEDWSGESLDPKLTEKLHDFDNVSAAASLVARLADRTSTVLVYAPKEIQLSRIYEFKKGFPKGKTLTWYVFTENPQ